MRITSVSFRASIQLKSFQHAHVEATAAVGETDQPHEVLLTLKDFVAAELRLAKEGTRPVKGEGRFSDLLDGQS